MRRGETAMGVMGLMVEMVPAPSTFTNRRGILYVVFFSLKEENHVPHIHQTETLLSKNMMLGWGTSDFRCAPDVHHRSGHVHHGATLGG